MPYLEFLISVPEESREAVIARLFDLGSSGVSEREGRIAAYFEDRGQSEDLCRGISRLCKDLESSGLSGEISYEYALLPETDWNEEWKKSFTPIDVGMNLMIVPSWVRHDTGRIPIIIDPGMVFGTGHHESTRDCLALIEKYSGRVPANRFLDIGTGTGILSVCAARLGFTAVHAVDIDPLAVDAARRNAEMNGMTNISVREGDVTTVPGTYDFIAANLLSEILRESSGEIAGRLNRPGVLILSGMMRGQEEDVKAVYQRLGFRLEEQIVSGEWVSLAFSR